MITAGLALAIPLILGCAVAAGFLLDARWVGTRATDWQFTLGVGMACAVTALPILILLMEKLGIFREPIGQRILRYASLDDIAIWGVLALILMDLHRIGMQIAYLLTFSLVSLAFRRLMLRLAQEDRWYVGLVWLAACACAAELSGLHFMIGAFLAGAVMDGSWFDQKQIDQLRHHVLLLLMPVYFLSAGLRTDWGIGGETVLLVAAALLAAAIAGKLPGVWLAGRILRWQPGEASMIGWLLQTKALIMIVFASVLLDTGIITHESFTALLLMAIVSTILTVPVVLPKLRRMQDSAH